MFFFQHLCIIYHRVLSQSCEFEVTRNEKYHNLLPWTLSPRHHPRLISIPSSFLTEKNKRQTYTSEKSLQKGEKTSRIFLFNILQGTYKTFRSVEKSRMISFRWRVWVQIHRQILKEIGRFAYSTNFRISFFFILLLSTNAAP